jgi:ABC-type transport system involved in multi-copper enzyme maturation permease subunit
MTPSFASLVVLTVILVVVQFVAALPWLMAVEIRMRARCRQPTFWGKALLICAGLGLVAGWYLDSNSGVLAGVGRAYMAVLHLQLGADFFVAVLGVMLTFWPKGGAIALSAFREGIRQPMFWVITLFAAWFMAGSPLVPYFTFGEDLKMVVELCYAFTMLAPALFGVLEASMSVSDEIEGRTAVTVMSKPVSRRQFLLGKFSGLLLSALFMTVMLGWLLIWVVLYGRWFTRMPAVPEVPDPAWVGEWAQSLYPASSAADMIHGIGLWLNDALMALPQITIGFCQVMVLVAVAVALATRVPMVINLIVCLVVYYLGHLTPIMTEVTRTQYRLVYFVAQLFDTLMPGLDLFDVGTAIVREAPLPFVEYGFYTLNVALYAAMYTAIALLFGLILFEDRDLA